MSVEMDEGINRWAARLESPLVLGIIQVKTTVSESSRQFDLPPSEIESWIDQAKSVMENALKVKPEGIREQYYVAVQRAAGSVRGSDVGEPHPREKWAALLGQADET
jgi:hypothetical protein